VRESGADPGQKQGGSVSALIHKDRRSKMKKGRVAEGRGNRLARGGGGRMDGDL